VLKGDSDMRAGEESNPRYHPPGQPTRRVVAPAGRLGFPLVYDNAAIVCDDSIPESLDKMGGVGLSILDQSLKLLAQGVIVMGATACLCALYPLPTSYLVSYY